nr:MAG TPA: hypothetical protein [Caudoviricetes sp.]
MLPKPEVEDFPIHYFLGPFIQSTPIGYIITPFDKKRKCRFKRKE